MSVRLSHAHAAAAGLLLCAQWEGDIDRLLQQRRANVGSATVSAYVVAEHRLVNTYFTTVYSISSYTDMHTGALPVNKPETTAMVIIARWLQVLHTAFSYSTYSRRRVAGCRRRSASL